MKEYKSFGALAAALQRNLERLPADLGVTMEKSAELVEKTAKEEIGHYQTENMGPFTPWAPLAPGTVTEKQRLGYADQENDNPELRTGAMRDSITHVSSEKGFIVGSESQILLDQELGTSRGIPPRPMLGPALYRNIPTILDAVGKTVVKNLEGKK